jgi:hypothetical protein
MKDVVKTRTELEYRIKRYKEMGNGAMCQRLNNQLKNITPSM